jgi:hypothetical protein
MPLTVERPALNTFVTEALARSTSATALFSCSVTAAWPAPLMLTYSGSGSVGATTPASVNGGSADPSACVSGTFVADQSATGPERSSTCRKPAGSCGRSPLLPPLGLNSSSRSFSIATIPRFPETSIESGWPPRSMLRTRLASASRTTSSRPLGCVNDSLVLTTTST